MTTDHREMPIQLASGDHARIARGERIVRVRSVPWSIFTQASERQCRENHGQTLEGIANRCGFSACEALAVLACSKWHQIDNEFAHRLLYAHVAVFNRGGLLALRDEHPTHSAASSKPTSDRMSVGE
jgi:hypothetical protein